MDNIKDIIIQAAARSYKKLEKKYDFALGDIEIQLPKREEYGDYSTPASLKIAKEKKLDPVALSEEAAELIRAEKYDFLEKVEVYKPGFVNFFLSRSYLLNNLKDIYIAKDDYGKRVNPNPDKVIIEFVSANPTGPLNVVNARAAVVGDVLAKLLKLNGRDIHKEYYINDAGHQVDLLGESILVRIKQHLKEDAELKEDYYHGEYLKDIAKEIIEQGIYEKYKDSNELLDKLKEFTLNKLIGLQKESLSQYNVTFDCWYKESDIRKTARVQEVLDILKEKGLLYNAEGKIFFKSTQFGDEKDRVIMRDIGTPTYFLVDMAYHLDKIRRGFNLIIDLWGPDHDGYMPRMKGALKSFGFGDDKFMIIIIQQVNLLEKSKKVQMSKRLGSFVLMDDLIKDIGKDAARFFFLYRSISSHLDFDMDLARKQSDDNPVYYVQYAYARICNIFVQAVKKNIKIKYEMNPDNWELEPQEIKLMKKLAEYPVMIRDSALRLQPNMIPDYVLTLSTIFHQFYTECRVINEDNDGLMQNRLFLTECARRVFKNGLDIMGITAPERM